MEVSLRKFGRQLKFVFSMETMFIHGREFWRSPHGGLGSRRACRRQSIVLSWDVLAIGRILADIFHVGQ